MGAYPCGMYAACAHSHALLCVAIPQPLMAGLVVSRAVLPDMLSRDAGAIVNVQSPACIVPWPGATAYCAARAGFKGMAAALRADLRATRIKVMDVILTDVRASHMATCRARLGHILAAVTTTGGLWLLAPQPWQQRSHASHLSHLGQHLYREGSTWCAVWDCFWRQHVCVPIPAARSDSAAAHVSEAHLMDGSCHWLEVHARPGCVSCNVCLSMHVRAGFGGYQASLLVRQNHWFEHPYSE